VLEFRRYAGPGTPVASRTTGGPMRRGRALLAMVMSVAVAMPAAGILVVVAPPPAAAAEPGDCPGGTNIALVAPAAAPAPQPAPRRRRRAGRSRPAPPSDARPEEAPAAPPPPRPPRGASRSSALDAAQDDMIGGFRARPRSGPVYDPWAHPSGGRRPGLENIGRVIPWSRDSHPPRSDPPARTSPPPPPPPPTSPPAGTGTSAPPLGIQGHRCGPGCAIHGR
jgi:hypothetical protein